VSVRAVVIGSCGSNLASLSFALARLSVEAPVTEDPREIAAASHVFLPGVGAARAAMRRLGEAGLVELLPTLTQPLLGICLGMQILFARSEEEDTPCLAIIPGEVRRLAGSADLPVPHMGWNQLDLRRPSPLLDGIESGAYAYFVHSYAAPPGDVTLATADYGGPFSAVVAYRNFFGAQFHPERSSETGARLLANFLKL
jgi:imidazole glycerol-phosphate synthase subunit HisH